MRAIVIAVGSEMLTLDRPDTNSLYITRRLREIGVLTDLKMVAADHLENLTWAVKKAWQQAQLVVVIGGLGPTEDDITREAVANALKKNLVYREEILDAIAERFRRRGLVMAEINTRQAFVVDGAQVIANEMGTAPGQLIEEGHCKVLLLPGPPPEMKAMFDRVLESHLRPLANFFIAGHAFKLSGIGESDADALLAPIYSRTPGTQTTILASPGLVEVHVLGRSRESDIEARRLAGELADKIRAAVRPYLFAEGDVTLEAHLVAELARRRQTLAVAESCSGGLLASLLTSVPGASAAFRGGVVAYANDIKEKLLGVRIGVLRRYGAVSEKTAAEMAEGARRLAEADYGLAITGIAGPEGGSPEKPVGLVFIALAAAAGTAVERHQFGGDREMVRLRAARAALDLLRRRLPPAAGART